MSQAAETDLRYFNNAATVHYVDEEYNLLPVMQSSAKGEDAIRLTSLPSDTKGELRHMDAIRKTAMRALRHCR